MKSISDQDTITKINEVNRDAINAMNELGMIFSEEELEDTISRLLDENEDCDNDVDNDDNDDDGDCDEKEGAEDQEKEGKENESAEIKKRKINS